MNLEHIVNIYKSRSVAALPAATAYPYMLRCNREAPVLETWFSFFGLATEAQQVVALRLWKLGAGGLAAQEEAFLMVNEKAQAGTMTMLGLMMGVPCGDIVASYRREIQANAARLAER
jgi:hypothetical protein